MSTQICPCDTGKAFAECCEPVITNLKKPIHAVDVMRARYTAFVKAEIDYIVATISPAKRSEYDVKNIENWSKTTDWKNLQIIRAEQGGPKDEQGEVEFIAFYREKDTVKKHHELATFKKIEDQWYFEDGKAVGIKQVVRDSPKLGRNDPCHCGSGKKFKKCHGLAA